MLSLRTIRRTTLLPFGLLCAAFLAGCASPTGLLPSTPQAQSIYNLLIVLVIVGAVVFVVVEGLLLYTVLRFSHSGGRGESHDTSRRLEVAWTAAPAIVLAVLFSISTATLSYHLRILERACLVCHTSAPPAPSLSAARDSPRPRRRPVSG